jgi:hypothetical protein
VCVYVSFWSSRLWSPCKGTLISSPDVNNKQCLDQKSGGTLHTILEHLDVEFQKSKKVSESRDPQDSDTFLLQNGMHNSATFLTQALWGCPV